MAFLDYDGLSHFKNKQDAMNTPVEESSTASQAYEAGEYFTYSGKICKALSDIASGAAIKVYPAAGYNCKVVKLGDELSEVKTAFDNLGLSVVDGALNITYTV